VGVYRAILLSLAGVAVIIVAQHPLATNDGPVHVAFSSIIHNLGQPNHELQQQAYTVDFRPKPNLVVYFLMTFLMRVFSPDVTESIVQALCLIGPLAAGYFALHMIDPKNAWLSLFVLPLSLNQMFFLGLYNHCLSTAAFLLTIGAYFWMNTAPSIRRALVVSGALLLAFQCHASGFIMGVAGLGAMTAARFVLMMRRGYGPAQAAWELRCTLLSLLVPIFLAALFAIPHGIGIVSFGPGVDKRMYQFAILKLLAVSPSDKFIAFGISLLLTAASAVAVVRIARGRDLSSQRRDAAIGAIAAAVLAVIIMLGFPDHLGGAWTHFRRFIIYPYLWGLIILACQPIAARVSALLMTAGTVLTMVLLGSAVSRQAIIQEQMAPLAEVDQRIGSHCTVLPVVLDRVPVNEFGGPINLRFQPFYQFASRLELRHDRVVLFNYLARLENYPVRFRPNVEPQRLVFHWKHEQEDNDFDTIDIDSFERVSGMRVDYVLVWGRTEGQPPFFQKQIGTAVAGSVPVFRSQDGRVVLYHRMSEGSLCVAPDPSLRTGEGRLAPEIQRLKRSQAQRMSGYHKRFIYAADTRMAQGTGQGGSDRRHRVSEGIQKPEATRGADLRAARRPEL
jgi:hypothetical protein